MPSFSEENYLKTIYHLSKQREVKVSVKSIADSLKNNPASVIDMLKKLKHQKLIQYDKTKGAKLTAKGEETALVIVRKHRLWEVFLKEKLGYNWDEVHDIAEQLEHIKQNDLANRLDKFLNFPEYDPHGDPIPKQNGKVPEVSRVTLYEAKSEKTYSVVAVKDASKPFLKYLQDLEIGIGTKIKVIEKIKFDESMHIVIGKNQKVTVSKKFSENILIA